MGLVIRAAALLALVAAAPAAGEEVARWRDPVEEASRRFGVPIEWIEKVMRRESAGRTSLGGRPIVSSAGAVGLMQLMPGTWRDVRARLGPGSDPHDPRDNILAGTFYLRAMYDQFGYPGLFAAYNAGPARYAEYRAGGRGLPRETRDYVAALAGQSDRMTQADRMPLREPAGAGATLAGRGMDPPRREGAASGIISVGAVRPVPGDGIFFVRRDVP